MGSPGSNTIRTSWPSVGVDFQTASFASLSEARGC